MEGVRAIFFDIGDTLVFDEPPLRERFWSATQATGLVYEKERLPQAFRAGQEYALARYLQGVGNDDAEVQREFTARTLAALDVPPLSAAQWQALAEAFAAVPWKRYVHPGAISLLETLRERGFVVGAISDWEETLPDVLAELALAPHLDALAVSAVVGVTKPHPRLFQDALRQAGVPPEASLHVGDWYELDVCGARAAGMRAILFDHQGRTPDADCPRVESFDALAALLLSLSGPLPALVGHPSPVGTREGPVTTAQVLEKIARQETPDVKSLILPQSHPMLSLWPLSRSDGGGVPDEGGEGAAP